MPKFKVVPTSDRPTPQERATARSMTRLLEQEFDLIGVDIGRMPDQTVGVIRDSAGRIRAMTPEEISATLDQEFRSDRRYRETADTLRQRALDALGVTLEPPKKP